MRKGAVSILFVAFSIALADCGKCELSECSCDGFTYSCGSGNRTTSYDYDSIGRVARRTISYENGHTVVCTYRYNSVGQCGGECHEVDNGAKCEWGS